MYLSLGQAAKLIPTTSGRPPSACSLWRWCRKGFKTPSGEIVRLEHHRFGSRIAVTHEALDAFSKRLAEAWETPPAPEPATPKARKRRAPTSNDSPDRQAQIAAATARVLARGKGAA